MSDAFIGIGFVIFVIGIGLGLIYPLRARRLACQRNRCDPPKGKRVLDRRRRQGSR